MVTSENAASQKIAGRTDGRMAYYRIKDLRKAFIQDQREARVPY